MKGNTLKSNGSCFNQPKTKYGMQIQSKKRFILCDGKTMRPTGTKDREILTAKIHFKKAKKMDGDTTKRREAERTNISNGNQKMPFIFKETSVGQQCDKDVLQHKMSHNYVHTEHNRD